MKRARIVEKEMRRSWLIGNWRMQGKWKDYKMEKGRENLRMGKVNQNRGAIEGGKEANGMRNELGG